MTIFVQPSGTKKTAAALVPVLGSLLPVRDIRDIGDLFLLRASTVINYINFSYQS